MSFFSDRLFRKKLVSDIVAENGIKDGELKRCLTPVELVSIGNALIIPTTVVFFILFF